MRGGMAAAAKQFVSGMFAGPSQDESSAKNRMNPPDDDTTPVEIIDGEKYYKEALENQKSFHPIWYRNIAAYAGQQWLDWNSQTNWFQETASPSWRVRLTHNLIMPMVRAAVAQELDSSPRFYGMPVNSDPKSVAAARIAGRIFEAKYYEDDFLNLFQRLRFWTRMTGSAWIFALKDKGAGKTWSDDVKDEKGMPVLNPDGTTKTQKYATGDVAFTVDNSFEVLLDPNGADDFNLHRRVMRAKMMTVAEIKSNWGVDVKPEHVTMDIMYQVRVMSIVDASGRYRTSTAEAQLLKDMAIVKHYFEIASKQYPNGREWIYANGVVLEPVHDLEYWYLGKRALPAGMSDDIKIPGRCHGGSGIEQVLPIQVQVNKMSSQVVENANLMNRPKYLSPVGSLQDDQLTDQPAEVVEYVPGPNGQKPEPMTPPEMPQYFFQKYNELKQLMQQIYGIHDTSMGQLPRRATSGVAIDALQSADAGPVTMSMRACGSSVSRVFSIALKTMQELYTEARIVRLVGRDHTAEAIEFKGADLEGCDMVRADFGAHMTRGQRINLAMQMAEAKIITPEKALEIMELGNIDAVYDQDSFQKNYAQQENMAMAKGMPQMVGAMDEHDVHIAAHLGFVHSNPSLAPEILALEKMHLESHYQAKAAGASPVGAGAPGIAGGPPAPLPAGQAMPGNMPPGAGGGMLS